MKKRVLACVCITVLIASFGGCKSKDSNTNSNETSNTTATDNTTTTDNITPTDTVTEGPTESATDNTESSPTDKKITLRMAWWGSQTRHDRTVQAIELYESQNQNIDIEYEFYDFDGYFNKLNTIVVSNDVWDIYQMGSNFTTYQDKIVYLNDYIANGDIDVSDIPDNFLSTTKDVDGNIVGLSNGINTYGIAYDPQMFLDAGVAEPTGTWTWDDWYNACITINEKLGVYGSSKLDDWICGFSMAVPQEKDDSQAFNATLDGLGFTDFTYLEDYFVKRTDLVNAGAYPDPGALAEITNIENDFVATGEAAMTWVATNQFETLQVAAGKELKLINPPLKYADGELGLAVQSSQMLCVSKDSGVPLEAAKFIAWFETSVDCNNILLGERGIPVSTKVREALSANLTESMQAVYTYVDLVASMNKGESSNVVPAQATEIQEQYKYILDKVIYGEMSASDAAKEFYDFAAKAFE